MKIARLVVLGVTTLGLLCLQDVPAAWAFPTVTIRSYADFGSGGFDGFTIESCDLGHPGSISVAPEPVVEKGPTPVPLGTHTWGFTPPTPGALGPYWRVDSLSSIFGDEVKVYSDAGTAVGAAFAEVDVDASHRWYGLAPLSVSAGSWQIVGANQSTSYTWREVDDIGTTVGSPFTGSIGDLIAQIGGDRPGLIGLGFGCNGMGEFHLDDAKLGFEASAATWDYEGGISSTSIAVTDTDVTAGRRTNLSCELVWDGFLPASPQMVLQGRSFGSAHWRRIASVPLTKESAAAYQPEPLRQTSYRWRFLGDQGFDGSTSATVTVNVHTVVSAHAPARVALGSMVRVHGSTFPKKPGQRIRLWHGDRLLAAARVTSKGTFSLTTRATSRGRLRLVAKIGSSQGNLRGSKTVLIRVH